MKTYFSIFISGFGEVVKESLSLIINDLKIIKLLDGLVVYKTNTDPDEIRKIRFFNNSYLLIKLFNHSSLEDALSTTLRDKVLLENIKKEVKSLGKTFRIIFSDKNRIVALNENKTSQLEQQFSNDLKLDKANPDVELWFLKRSEGEIFIGTRLTRPEGSEKHLQKGELRPELAHFLCLLSEPNIDDIFLDPFAGSGAIVLERSKYFPYKKIFAGDKDKQIFKKLQTKLKDKKNVISGKWDATNLSSLTGGSIDKIVTDPPWGYYKKEVEDIENFYTKILREFSRVLKPVGLAVILMGQKEIFEKSLTKISDLKLLEKLDILVSGKKAGVYKIRKE